MVFQHYNLFAHKTVLENVMEGLIVAKESEEKGCWKQSEQVLDKSGFK